MKLYYYSNELLMLVEMKWVKVKYASVGILIVTIILFGVIELSHSVGFTLGSHSANTLAAENNFLQQQVIQISPRVSKLEMQTMKLNERANNLHMLLPRRKIVGDTASIFTNAAKGFKLQTLILAAKSIRP